MNISQLQFQSCPCFYCPTYRTRRTLYFNGYQLSDSRVAYTIQSGTIVLSISNATSKDFGVYEVVTSFCGIYPFLLFCSQYFDSIIGPFGGGLYEVESYTVVKYGM